MPLRKEILERDEDGLYPDPEGELEQVLEVSRGKMTVITRVRGPDDDPVTVSDLEQAADPSSSGLKTNESYPTNDDGEPLCTGKDDGQCSRTVDEPNGTCWQH